ncbi:hypothetical protein EON63_23885, partial [archaeon]
MAGIADTHTDAKGQLEGHTESQSPSPMAVDQVGIGYIYYVSIPTSSPHSPHSTTSYYTSCLLNTSYITLPSCTPPNPSPFPSYVCSTLLIS